MAGLHVRWLLLLVAAILLLAAVAPAETSGLRRLSDGSDGAVPELAPPADVAIAETAPPTPAPLTLAQKKEICNHDFDDFNVVLRHMTVNPEPRTAPTTVDAATTPSPLVAHKAPTYPRILCYVITISPYHDTRAKYVADTWGQRCDKLLFMSNTTGVMVVNANTSMERSYEIVNMKAPPDYYSLWLKQRESLQYLHDHYRHDYDWFYKADDDTYLVVDNLRAYLRRPEIMMNYKRQPMHLGKRFNLTEVAAKSFIADKDMAARWWQKWDRWVFNSGGPGYAMNRLFLDKFVATMNDKTCLSAPWAKSQPEDTATAYCMSWHDVVPWDTRDTHGRPRWHATNPGGEYGMTPELAKGFWFDYHQGVGGLRYGDECCAPDSIGYHYVKGVGMYHMERALYFCRSGDDVLDLETYNKQYGLGISTNVLTTLK